MIQTMKPIFQTYDSAAMKRTHLKNVTIWLGHPASTGALFNPGTHHGAIRNRNRDRLLLPLPHDPALS